MHSHPKTAASCRLLLQGLSPLWALSHFGLLALCAMVGLAGMIVALVRFGNTICGLVMSTHQVLGLMSVGESSSVCSAAGPGSRGAHSLPALHVLRRQQQHTVPSTHSTWRQR